MNKLMSKPTVAALMATLLAGVTAALWWARTPQVQANSQMKASVLENYGKLPLAFEPNQGQADASVKYLSRGNGYTLLLTGNEAVMSLHNEKTQNAQLKMKLAGAHAAPLTAGEEPFVGKSNYFIGNDPANWRAGVPHYGKVRYDEVWPGVDMVWYGNQRKLEYDFIVQPGVNPQQIKLAFEGADQMRLDEAGNLVLAMAAGEVIQQAPVIYQDSAQGRQSIAGKYVLTGAREVAFAIGDYDTSLPLVIDPVLTMATYLGGSLLDNVLDIAMDAAGNVYCTGRLDSTEFPVGSGNKQGSATYVAKLSADGTTLLYATVLDGSGYEVGMAIAVDGSNQAVVAGDTNSSNFPLLFPFEDQINGGDAFVTKLDANGVLNNNCGGCSFSTFLGGNGGDIAYGLALSSSNRVYVVGQTDSRNFPVQNQFQGNGFLSAEDGFLTVFAANGQSLVYSTYIRGGSGDLERADKVAVDSTGNAYVIGQTSGNNLQTRGAGGAAPAQAANAGGMDAFVAKFNPALTGDSSLVYATYLGGSATEFAGDIAVDAQNRAYVTGQTGSVNFPRNAVSGATVLDNTNEINEAFVTCFNSNGTARVFSTFLGGNGEDDGQAIRVDSANNIYVQVSTLSAQGLPLVNPTQGALAGGWDAYIAKLAPEGRSILFSTYLGGTSTETAFGIAVSPNGLNLAVGGVTTSTNFPVTSGAVQSQLGGNRDGYVARISFNNPDTIGVFRPSLTDFFLRNSNTNGGADQTVNLSFVSDAVPVAGDWDGDGDDETGIFRPSVGQFILILRPALPGCGTAQCQAITRTIVFGQTGDFPIAGDWDGNGTDTPGVLRAGQFLLTNGVNGQNVHGSTPPIDFNFGFGVVGDLPVAGDWNGDGIDSIGIFRAGSWVFSNNNAPLNANEAFIVQIFGTANDLPVAGDWDGNGIDTFGIFANGVFTLTNQFQNFDANEAFTVNFGQAGDRPVAGDWNGLP